MAQKQSQNAPPLLPCKRLCHQIRHIHVDVAVGCVLLILGAALLYEMVCDAVRFLLDCGPRQQSVAQH